MTDYTTIIKTPRKFFQSVEEESLSESIKKVTIPIIVFAIVSSIIANRLFSSFYEFLKQPIPSPIFSVGMSIISVPISILIMSALLQLSLKILKIKAKYSQTVKALLFPAVFIFALSIIVHLIIFITPIILARFITYIIASIAIGVWFIILLVTGLSEFHKITIGKAVGAYFLSMALIIAIQIVIMIIIVSLGVGLFSILKV